MDLWWCLIAKKYWLLAETCSYFLLLNTIIYPYYHGRGFMTDIYLTISIRRYSCQILMQLAFPRQIFEKLLHYQI